VLLLSFLGCCGSIKESVCLLALVSHRLTNGLTDYNRRFSKERNGASRKYRKRSLIVIECPIALTNLKNQFFIVPAESPMTPNKSFSA
jgi:hypothetical protein